MRILIPRCQIEGLGGILKFLKQHVSVLGLILMALCYFSMSAAHSITIVSLGMIFLGASMNIIQEMMIEYYLLKRNRFMDLKEVSYSIWGIECC